MRTTLKRTLTASAIGIALAATTGLALVCGPWGARGGGAGPGMGYGPCAGQPGAACPQGQPGSGPGYGFMGMDADGDGKISRDEAAGRPGFAANFDAIAADKDGFVTHEEMFAWRQANRGQGYGPGYGPRSGAAPKSG